MDSQQPNNGFGPLSKPRGSGAVFGAFLVVVVSGAVHIVNAIAFSSIKESKDEILFLFFGAALVTLSLVLSELVRRVCLVNEERLHRHTRYEGLKLEETSQFYFHFSIRPFYFGRWCCVLSDSVIFCLVLRLVGRLQDLLSIRILDTFLVELLLGPSTFVSCRFARTF